MSSATRALKTAGVNESSSDNQGTIGSPDFAVLSGWEPILLPWPRLSRVALPGIVGEFVRLATRDSEADPAAVLATFLVRFGAEVYGYEIGRGPALRIGETLHPPRLFVAICGASSKARKGTSAGPVKRLFTFDTSEEREESSPMVLASARESSGPLSTGEGLAFQVRDSRKEWRVNHKTGEGFWAEGDPGEADKRLFILDEELAAALSCSKREGNTLSACLRVFWDSGDYAPITKSLPIKTTNAHVCITTHITVEELGMAMSNVQAFNGFANRFLWILARRSKRIAFPTRMPDHEFLPIQREMQKLITLAQGRGILAMDAPARELWEHTYDDLSTDHPGLAGCVINRAEAQTQRLALNYALLDGQDYIGESHLQAALGLWEHAKASALYIFGGRSENPIEETILNALTQGPTNTTELFKCFSGHMRKESLQTALQKLIGSGCIVREKEQTRGRSRQVFRLRAKGELCEESETSPEAGKDNSHTSLLPEVCAPIVSDAAPEKPLC